MGTATIRYAPLLEWWAVARAKDGRGGSDAIAKRRRPGRGPTQARHSRDRFEAGSTEQPTYLFGLRRNPGLERELLETADGARMGVSRRRDSDVHGSHSDGIIVTTGWQSGHARTTGHSRGPWTVVAEAQATSTRRVPWARRRKPGKLIHERRAGPPGPRLGPDAARCVLRIADDPRDVRPGAQRALALDRVEGTRSCAGTCMPRAGPLDWARR
jgi:hypothetical protein